MPNVTCGPLVRPPAPPPRSAHGVKRQLRSYVWDPSYRMAGRRSLLIETPVEEINGPDARLWVEVNAARPLQQGVDVAPGQHPEAWLAGLAPSTRDVRFAMQMTYAVAQWTLARFRRALGREPDFAFGGPLVLRLFDAQRAEAIYDRAYARAMAAGRPSSGAIRFGWFRQGGDGRGASQAGAIVNTALSYDIIVHETAHALIDGVRPHFMTPTNPDVLALHEGLADLIAVFSHFAWADPVAEAIRADPAHFSEGLLRAVARQFGHATGDDGTALRTLHFDWDQLLDETPADVDYEAVVDPHARGRVLASAVFEAFGEIYRRKAEPILAPHRRGDQLSDAMIGLLVDKATRLADHFLDIVIRALDFLPPVDPTFGEYLRALITADRALVPDDPWGYREALIYAFRRHRIPVQAVDDLSEESLEWLPPAPDWQLRTTALTLVMPALLRRDVGAAAGHVRDFLEHNRSRWRELGLAPAAHAVQIGLAECAPATITIEQLRLVRRGTPGQPLAAGVAIVLVSTRTFARTGAFRGGCTLLLDEHGGLCYVIRKHVDSLDRFAAQRYGTPPRGIW